MNRSPSNSSNSSLNDNDEDQSSENHINPSSELSNTEHSNILFPNDLQSSAQNNPENLQFSNQNNSNEQANKIKDKRYKRKLPSFVWEYFEQIDLNRTKCKKCGFACDYYSTKTTMINHLLKQHGITNKAENHKVRKYNYFYTMKMTLNLKMRTIHMIQKMKGF